MKKSLLYLLLMIGVAVTLTLTACSGSDGATGVAGVAGVAGGTGADATITHSGPWNGDEQESCVLCHGSDGQDDLKVGDNHGLAYLEEYNLEHGKAYVTSEITSATAAADGTVTIDFSVEDADGDAVDDLDTSDDLAVSYVRAAVTYLDATTNNWVPYFQGTDTAEVDDDVFNDVVIGNVVAQAGASSSADAGATLTNNNDGTYQFILAADLSAQTEPDTNSTADFANGEAITYNRALTHRISIMFGGHSGYTDSSHYDFVPDDSAGSGTRNIISSTACMQCHGRDFSGHGGDRVTVENCMTCHNPYTFDETSDYSMDAKILFHKIHMGSGLTQTYSFDHRGHNVDWSEVEFPASVENCETCHYQPEGETLEDVDNWKANPNRDACGSCHDDVVWADGTNHSGGAQADDTGCATCHPAGGASGADKVHGVVTAANTPEYTVAITLTGDTDSDGVFEDGESPIVNIAISKDGTLVDHTALVESDAGVTDGKLANDHLFVYGPLSKMNPVLTEGARSVITTNVQTFALTDAEKMTINVDGGATVDYTETGEIEHYSGEITVTVDAADFAAVGAATAAEVAAWLNADADFAARAVAEVTSTNEVEIYSRNMGTFFSIEVGSGGAADDLFAAADLDEQHIMGGYDVYVHFSATEAEDNARVTATTSKITYALDAVDDLITAGRSGTYMVLVEAGDYGRVSSSDYVTPSIGRATFQVGAATVEKPVAENCGACHNGIELHMDRHDVHIGDDVTYQCGACHDYQNGHATGDYYGGMALSRRVHGLHNSANLYDSQTTVGAGWTHDLEYPANTRECEMCHTSDTSGTWKTNPNRLACYGCHDTPEAQAHFKAMTYDPTP